MKKFLFLFCLFVSLTAFGQQQNLIPNSSFEGYTHCITDTIFSNRMIDSLKKWFVPKRTGTTDYYNSCLNGLYRNYIFNSGIPDNYLGYQNAHSGNGYIGLIPFWPNVNNYREYISVKLESVLQENKTYKFSFYTSLADSSKYAISKADFGVYFSEDSVFMPSSLPKGDPLPFQPQMVAGSKTEFLKDTANWIKITSIYKAKGGEKYLTIGNFNDDANTNHIIVDSNSTFPYAYYYIDDVSLYEVIPQDISVSQFKFNTPCKDSLSVKIVNNGDSTIDFSQQALTVNLQLKENGMPVQQLQKTINSNQYNPNAPQPLAPDSGFWLSFAFLEYPKPNANYTISVEAQMQEDGDSSNNFMGTTFISNISTGEVNISDNKVCAGDTVELQYNKVSGSAVWQFSKDKNDWGNIGVANPLRFAPMQSRFFRLKVCGYLYSDTLRVKVKTLPTTINTAYQFCTKGDQLLQIEAPTEIDQINWYKKPKDGTAFHQGFSYSTIINENISYYLESVKDNCVSKERGVLKITLGGCELEIPNIFTPNGDGINDVFKYRQAEGKTIHTKIYDRWGKQVATFENNEGWTGKDAAAGTYFYVIKTQEKVYRGSVVLVK